MQTATDNGEDLLQELTLQYNKSRQQKITSEILDLAGGSQQQAGVSSNRGRKPILLACGILQG